MNRLLLAAALLGAVAATAPVSTTQAATPAKKPVKKPAPPVEAPLPPAEANRMPPHRWCTSATTPASLARPCRWAWNPKYDGYIDVQFGRLRYTMKPVLSTTGALRLEDVKGQALMLQIAYKSMLMDVKAGRRLVDDCVHERQLMAKRAAEGQPSNGLLGSDPSSPNAPVAAPVQR